MGISLALSKKRVVTLSKINSSKKAKTMYKSCFSTRNLSMSFVRILEKEGSRLSRKQVLNKIIKKMNDCNVEIDEKNKIAIGRRLTDIKNILVGIGMIIEHKTQVTPYRVEYFYAHDDTKELNNMQIRIENLQNEFTRAQKHWEQLQAYRIQLKMQSTKDSSSIPGVEETQRHDRTNDIRFLGKSKYEHISEVLKRRNKSTLLFPAFVKNNHLNECKILDSFTIFDYPTLERMESILNKNHFDNTYPNFMSTVCA